MGYNLLPIQTDAKSISEITNLLKVTFPKAKKYTEQFITWQYADNPIGSMMGFSAYSDIELAAHYALMPIKALIFGKEEKGLLSLNTATHPDHRGNKLFPTLAAKSFEKAKEQGFGFIVGVANAQSTPGFINKLDFQLIGRLEAKLGLGKIIHKPNIKPITYQRSWDKPSIEWRLSNPELLYAIKNNRVSAATDHFGIQGILKDFDPAYPQTDNHIKIGFRPIKLWMGIDHTIDWEKSNYFDIPAKLRPSPLNLIFKDLTEEHRNFDFSGVRFNALDFDAY